MCEKKTPGMSDRELTTRMASGERGAFREAYELWGRELFMFARALTEGNLADAEDVLQECFIRIWRNRRHLLSVVNLGAYLFATLRNAFLDFTRTESRELRRRTDRAEPAGLATERTPGSEVDPGEVSKALNSLSEDQRQVVVLKIWGGLTLAEIGDVLGVSPNTVASRYRSGIATLRRIMGDVL